MAWLAVRISGYPSAFLGTNVALAVNVLFVVNESLAVDVSLTDDASLMTVLSLAVAAALDKDSLPVKKAQPSITTNTHAYIISLASVKLDALLNFVIKKVYHRLLSVFSKYQQR